MLFTGKFCTKSSSFKICFPPIKYSFFPLPPLSYCFSPVSLNPDSLIDCTLISTAFLFFSLGHVAGAQPQPVSPRRALREPRSRARTCAGQEPEGGGCGGRREAMLPSRCHTARLTEAGHEMRKNEPRGRDLEAGAPDAGALLLKTWSVNSQHQHHLQKAARAPLPS